MQKIKDRDEYRKRQREKEEEGGARRSGARTDSLMRDGTKGEELIYRFFRKAMIIQNHSAERRSEGTKVES